MGYSYPQKRIIVVSLLLLATVVTIVGVFLGVALRPKDGSDGSEIVGTTTNDVNIEVSEVGLWPHELSDIPIDSRIHFGTLPNGMRYMIGPTTSTTTSSSTTRTSSETLSLRLHVQAGSIDEDEGKNGVSCSMTCRRFILLVLVYCPLLRVYNVPRYLFILTSSFLSLPFLTR